MHLLPPFVTTHHQNVAFLVLLLIIVLVQQCISDAPFDDSPQSSSDQSSSDGERRRPFQPRAGVSTQPWPRSITRTMSCRSHSGPMFLGRPVEMNEPGRNLLLVPKSRPLLSSNNSRPPSLENTIKAFEDKEKMKNLDENKNNRDQPNSGSTLRENACEQLLPTWDPITGKPYKDYELRVEACRKLDELTGWVAVKAAINTMENSAKLNQCSTIYEDDDDDGNGIDRLSNPKPSPRDKGKSKTEKLKQFFKFNKKKEKINDYLPSLKCNSQRSISFRDDGYENRQMHKGLIEPRRSLDQTFEQIVSRTESVDKSQTLQRNSIQRSTSTQSTHFDGTLTRHSMSGFSKSKMPKNFVEGGRRSVDNHIELHSSYTEIGAESKNLPCVLRRSRSLSVGAEFFDKKADEEYIFKDSIINTVQWDVLRTGMLCMADKNVKKNILAMCRSVNYELQLLILQNLLLKTSDSGSLDDREQNLKIRENMIDSKEKFKAEKTDLLDSLNRTFKGQLGEEFNKALVELRDKVVAHWTWLYEQQLPKKDSKNI
uniref:Uncharacterized protein n=1 Tax=Globodera rostochiensis TaxID=31243 RepID=A0A914IEM1_GLORO